MRVVSLVPSLTEAVAVTAPDVLVGCTDWCTHPADLDDRGVARVRGTKNPDVDAVVALRPDLVVANEEENRPDDLDALRAAGLEVLVTDVRTVPQAFTELDRVLAACGATRPRWLDDAETVWAAAGPVVQGRRLAAVVPIWRRPWMALGRDTFAGDVLARLGVDHVLADHEERYPRFDPAGLGRLDLVVLPGRAVPVRGRRRPGGVRRPRRARRRPVPHLVRPGHGRGARAAGRGAAGGPALTVSRRRRWGTPRAPARG